mmetsp:Transcript_13851/g.31735  ORF Transcript_13851/g.31735 Transcript_13851/m.31735 type:complete len:213 (-) Transcript_13851:106-744(-)
MASAAKSAAEHLYWARTKSEQAPLEFKALDPAEKQRLEDEGSSHAGAAWNKASTWEEKNVTKWAHARLKEALLPALAADFRPPQAMLSRLPAAAEECSACSVRVASVGSVDGDVTYVVSRGKQRVIFELALKLTLEMELRSSVGELQQILTGELRVPEVSADDLSETKMPSYTNTCEQSGYSSAFNSAAAQCWPQLQKVLTDLVDEAKVKWR